MEVAGFGSDPMPTFDDLSSGMAMGGLMPDAASGEIAVAALDAPAEPESGTIGDANALIMDLPVVIKVVLGSAKMPLASVAKLAKGSVVKLDKKVGEPVDILVNGRLIARGEVVVLDEEGSRFGVVLTQVGGPTPARR